MEKPRSGLAVRNSRASSVVVHTVPPGSADRFMEWQRGVTQAVERFPGYSSTDIYPPAGPEKLEWVAVIQFESPETLQGWLDSPQRAEWTAKLPTEVADFKIKTLPSGFGPWFAGLVGGPGESHPPGWMMALTVLLGVYPTIMLLSIFVGPYTSPLGMALSILISNTLSTVLLQWVVVPLLTKVLAPWFTAGGNRQAAGMAAGVVVVLLALTGMALLFRQITG